ncbi:MAG: hypothetical protein COU07_00600 [Candidatus Harrisonbacteria bacterium CG10_big_fil_rev_8_21_14_0_10_40_38]|uniref:Uncharacterized protein n=1 Tax=Candidatus Harrisonbacteria bacterium CG10_big_fil_rev_8_21_14_0_10_40_38 TaxID=1974583 RepID=A0A2H0UUE9_9BACT|nr:MAG: hypothetical protein COU07_00600 [Candidatus Harrisonbacteria bacterium CG10_big_fil_rev_8_21_14_0_10_40_38]
MFQYATILGFSTIAIGLISYSFYFRDLFKGKTRPDPFSWLIWSILAGTIFFAQLSRGGGTGTWATALTAVVCFVIAVVAFFWNKSSIKVIDQVSLVGAFSGIGIWQYTEDPLFTVLIAIGIGILGFIPTFKKAFYRPYEETATTYFLNGLKFAVAFAALGAFNPVTYLYPVSMVLMNTSLTGMIVLRRKFL